MAGKEADVYLMAALSANGIVKIVKLSATEVKGDPEGVRYTNIEVIEEGGFDCPDGFYDVTVIGLAPMKVQRLNGYWSPVTVGQRRNL